MYVFEESTSDDIFSYDLSLEGWLFTSSGVYPSMYSFGRNAWIFYFVWARQDRGNSSNWIAESSSRFPEVHRQSEFWECLRAKVHDCGPPDPDFCTNRGGLTFRRGRQDSSQFLPQLLHDIAVFCRCVPN